MAEQTSVTPQELEEALREMVHTYHGALLDGRGCKCCRCTLAMEEGYRLLGILRQERLTAKATAAGWVPCQ